MLFSEGGHGLFLTRVFLDVFSKGITRYVDPLRSTFDQSQLEDLIGFLRSSPGQPIPVDLFRSNDLIRSQNRGGVGILYIPDGDLFSLFFGLVCENGEAEPNVYGRVSVCVWHVMG